VLGVSLSSYDRRHIKVHAHLKETST
jgi:hypothetical protein